ncbi:MAG: MFS transporter [Thaumarchaeota archaeon]|nr:MFS transporter [Nitrososphaerota archaeon]
MGQSREGQLESIQPDPQNPTLPKKPQSLFHHPDFMKLWIGESISVVGSQFSPFAITIAAHDILHAQRIEFGILAGLGTLPFLLFGLPVGVWADRYRRKPTMIYADLGRALILLSVPLAWIFGYLSMGLFYVVAFTTGVLTVFFEICYQSYLPSLVERSELVEANGKLQSTQASAGFVGPPLATTMVQIASAPIAILGDVIGYFSSAGFLSSIKKPEEALPRKEGRSALKDIKEGLSVVFGDTRLRSIAGCTATANLFSSAWGAIMIPYMLEDLALAEWQVGIPFVGFAVGGLIGAVLSSRISKKIGVGWTIIVFAVAFGVAPIPIYFATPGLAIPVIAVSSLFASMGSVLYNISQVSFRQALVPMEIQGRMNATMRTIVWGTLPIGGITGGILAQVLGYHTAIGLAIAAGSLAFLFVLFSPVRGIKEIPSGPQLTAKPAG